MRTKFFSCRFYQGKGKVVTVLN